MTSALTNLRWIITDELEEGLEKNFNAPEITGDQIVFLQYTSGSTGTPKSVMITHNNLMANERTI